MSYFRTPRNLVESFNFALLFFRITGLFPYNYNESKNQFILSWRLFAVTLFHMGLYIYVNITSLMENWQDYSQPMIGHSSLSAFGNLVLRLLDILITLLVFVPLLVFKRYHVEMLNLYMKISNELQSMGINVFNVYRRLFLISFAFVFIWIGEMTFAAWHSIYFFEQITQRPPKLKYYLVVTLSNFYKLLFVFYGNLQFFALFMISKQLNCYLKTLLDSYQQRHESKRNNMHIVGTEKFVRKYL